MQQIGVSHVLSWCGGHFFGQNEEQLNINGAIYNKVICKELGSAMSCHGAVVIFFGQNEEQLNINGANLAVAAAQPGQG